MSKIGNEPSPILELCRTLPLPSKPPASCQARNSSRVRDLLLNLPKLIISPAICETFTLFPRLPPELRNRVWRYAAHQTGSIALTEGNCVHTFDGQSVAPGIMQASQESRREGRRYYTLCRQQAHPRSPNFLGNRHYRTRAVARVEEQQNIVWINFAVDDFVFVTKFYTPQVSVLGLNFCSQVLSQIQHLVLPIYWFHSPSDNLAQLLALLRARKDDAGGPMLQSIVISRWKDMGYSHTAYESAMTIYRVLCQEHKLLCDQVRQFTQEANELDLLPWDADFFQDQEYFDLLREFAWKPNL